jgi:hypothetical protein
MSEEKKLIPPTHIGDGLYMEDESFRVSIAVNHHENKVAYIDIDDLDRAIEYLNAVKQRIQNK